jgi:hypothetical protein
MTITVTVSDGIQSANQEFSIKVTEETKKLVITTANVSTPENVAKVITLTASQRGVNFSIAGGRNQAKFSLSGNTLTFEATSFKNPGDNTYQVNIKATKGNDTTEKTLTVTVEASTRFGVGASRAAVAVRMAAQAVRKESKTASKVLLFKVGKTLMGRLSHIRHKDKQKSSSSTNGFVNGIQVSFADSQCCAYIEFFSSSGLPFFSSFLRERNAILKTISTFSAILISLLLMANVNANAKNTDQEAQKIIAEQLKATFNQTTFKNFSRAPMQGWWQAEISNEVIYFSPKEALALIIIVFCRYPTIKA